ncbi:MAG: hypothetical protein HZC37_02940 [Burkholderiales bacterium]|nr:hypothetical protein [Burkholderiales bacterium]
MRVALACLVLCAAALAGCGGGGGGDGGAEVTPPSPAPVPATGTATVAPASELAAIGFGDTQYVVKVLAGERSTQALTLLTKDLASRYEVTVLDGAAFLAAVEASGRWFLQVDARALAAGSSHLYRLQIRHRANGSVSELRGPIQVVAVTVLAGAQIGEAGGTLTSPNGDVRVAFDPSPGVPTADVTLMEGTTHEGRQLRLRFDRDVSGDMRPVRFEWGGATALSGASTAQRRKEGTSRRLDMSPGFHEWATGNGWFSAAGGYRLGEFSRPLHVLARSCLPGWLPPAPGQRLDVVCVYSAPAWRLSAPFPEAALPANVAEPVVLVHGYTPGQELGGGSADPTSTGCVVQTSLGLPCNTWGALPTLLMQIRSPVVVPFEFQWATNAPFEVVADELAEAIDRVHAKTGKPVTVVAHSFGGLLARTMLQGLGKRGRFDALQVAGKIRQVVTIGTPHSGILASAKTIGGVALPQGRDPALGSALINGCGQVSCHQAGESTLTSGEAELVGVELEEGSLLAKLATQPFPQALVPFKVGIGLALESSSNRLAFAEGDGLLSFSGQRFRPDLAASKPYTRNFLTCNGTVEGGVVQEEVLAVANALPGDDAAAAVVGYLHSGAQMLVRDRSVNRLQASVDSADHPTFRLVSSALLDTGCPIAPTIVVQPADLSVEAGRSAGFRVLAIGVPSPKYQWRRDGDPWGDAIGATLQLDAVAPADNGARFDVVVSNGVGQDAVSRAALLTVTTAQAPPAVEPAATKGRLATCSGSCAIGLKASGALVAAGRDPDVNNYHSLGSPGTTSGPWFALSAAPRARFVDMGSGNTFVIAQDGALWVTGNGDFGSLGNGAVTVETWTPVAGLADVRFVQGSSVASYAVTGAGQLWVAGPNIFGQLGFQPPNAQIFQNFWIPVPGLVDAHAVVSDGVHTLVLRADRTVWAAGVNSRGSESILGFGSIGNISLWTPVPGLTNVVDVATGFAHSLAVTEDGNLWATGDAPSTRRSSFGWTPQSSFAQVPGITGVRAVVAANFCSMALKADGSLWVAGLFEYSASGLGAGAPVQLDAWQQVRSLPPVVAMHTDCHKSLVITADGRLWVAGNNEGGALGFGDPQKTYSAPRTLPVWTLVESEVGF